MIRQRIILENYDDWEVFVYYSVGHYYADEIMRRLESVGCSGDILDDAYDNLSRGKLNTGLTYSNPQRRQTVMVIAKTSTAAQFSNSLNHECKHLEAHIAKALRLNPYGEPVAYLAGEINQKLYKAAAPLLCDCCRKKHTRYGSKN